MEFQLLRKKVVVPRFKLREWLKFDRNRQRVIDAAARKDADALGSAICTCLAAAFGLDMETMDEMPWYEIAEAFTYLVMENIPRRDVPILKSPVKSAEVDWDYEERIWYLWLHVLAKNYGWTAEYIAEMDIDDAVALMQEILVDEQLEKEFVYMLSEVAYPYNENTKKSEFKPLPRPAWMTKEHPQPRYKIPVRMMPVGTIIRHESDRSLTN